MPPASSRASTETLDNVMADVDASHNTEQASVPEAVPHHLLDKLREESQENRAIIGIDFGTTYSAVSHAHVEMGQLGRLLELESIQSVHNFPDYWDPHSEDRMKNEVPTQVIYPMHRRFREEEDLDNFNDALEVSAEPSDASETIPCPEELNQDEMMDLTLEESETFQWGYGVHEAWSLPSTHDQNMNRPLSRFKLLLDDSDVTARVRKDLGKTIKDLKGKRIVKNELHVIADYLTCLLRHTKRQIFPDGFDHSYRVEVVLCVPAIWKQKACRQMQAAMAVAMKRAKFEGVDVQNNSIENLFIVSEPEAAAAYVLAKDREISAGDAFVLLDAGGGTIDANTYEVSTTTPLRLTREVVPPGGGLHGSSFLNEAFAEFLRRLLAGETYLEDDSETINSIVERITHTEFERGIKRSFDYQEAKGLKKIRIPGLRENLAKGFRKHTLHIRTEKIKEIFLAQLRPIGDIMEAQIDAARERKALVQKVILIGGFAASISLQKYIKYRLDRYNIANETRIRIIHRKDNTATAVASGAVLRAFDKTRGPKRIAQSSYGILRAEFWGDHLEHNGTRPAYDHHDGNPYVKKTVDWVLKLGQEVPPVWVCEPFLCAHTFSCDPSRPLICREVLYVSDTSTRSHYRLSHPNNQGAEKVGEIIVDFTFLRSGGFIRPIEPQKNERHRSVGRRHYKVEYTMVITVVDRDLSCYAIFDGRIEKKCSLNIASGFIPGVK